MKMEKRRSIRRWMITFAACTAIASGLTYYKTAEIQAGVAIATSQPERFEVTESATAQSAHYVHSVKAIGVAVAPLQLALHNERSGHIVAVNLQAGAHVEKNQIIIQLDISEEQANLESALARSRLARTVYQRQVDLRVSNSVSQAALDRVLADLSVVKAEIAASRSVINKKTIRAPFDGVIGIHQFQTGQYLKDNTFVTTLVGSSKITWIEFSLPQFYGELAIGTQVLVNVINVTGDDRELPAVIIAGDSAISSGTRSRLYRASTETNIRHNASVEIQVPIGSGRNLIAIPANAVQTDGLGQFVFVLDDADDDKYRARRVGLSIEGQRGETVYVAGELNEGDTVATDGAFKLYEGLLVQTKVRPSLASTSHGNTLPGDE